MSTSTQHETVRRLLAEHPATYAGDLRRPRPWFDDRALASADALGPPTEPDRLAALTARGAVHRLAAALGEAGRR